MIQYRVWSGQGKPDRWLTEAELEKRWDWRRLHPEIRRRHLALYALSDHRIGFLSGARSAAQQAQLYIDRKGIGVAPAGLSWHEDDAYEDPVTGEKWAIAVDNIGASDLPGDELDMIDIIGHQVGLHDLSDDERAEGGKDGPIEPDENWHTQPDEFPNSRRLYKLNPTAYRLTVWDLPGDTWPPPAPLPPPAVPEDDMRIAILKPQGAYAVFLAETTLAGIALHVRWSGEGTAKVQAVIDAHVAAGADVRSVLITDLRNCFLLGPLPKGDPAYNWTADDFAGVD